MNRIFFLSSQGPRTSNGSRSRQRGNRPMPTTLVCLMKSKHS